MLRIQTDALKKYGLLGAAALILLMAAVFALALEILAVIVVAVLGVAAVAGAYLFLHRKRGHYELRRDRGSRGG